jgi:serine/threonine protein kinase
MIEKQIFQHKILKKIKEGGMGIVYKALDNKLERYFALKILPYRYKNNKRGTTENRRYHRLFNAYFMIYF